MYWEKRMLISLLEIQSLKKYWLKGINKRELFRNTYDRRRNQSFRWKTLIALIWDGRRTNLSADDSRWIVLEVPDIAFGYPPVDYFCSWRKRTSCIILIRIMPREHGRSYVFIAESELDHHHDLILKRNSIILTIFVLIYFILMNFSSVIKRL